MSSVLSVWAPAAGRVDVEVNGQAAPMAPVPGRPGWWAAAAPVPAGTDYAFRLDGGDAAPDPRSPRQPYGPDGASRTYDHAAFAGATPLARRAGERRGDLRAARRHVHRGRDAGRGDRAARPPDGARRHGGRADAGRRVPRRARLGLRRDRAVGRARALRRARTRSSGSWTPATAAGSPSSSTSSTTTSARATGSAPSARTSPTSTRPRGGPRSTWTRPGSDEVRVVHRRQRADVAA